MRLYQVRDPVCNNARLPAPSASEQQQWTFGMGNSFALLRI